MGKCGHFCNIRVILVVRAFYRRFQAYSLRDCEISDGEEGRATDDTDETRMILKACRLIPSVLIRVIRGSFDIFSMSLKAG
jgi:hypothetical protein